MSTFTPYPLTRATTASDGSSPLSITMIPAQRSRLIFFGHSGNSVARGHEFELATGDDVLEAPLDHAGRLGNRFQPVADRLVMPPAMLFPGRARNSGPDYLDYIASVLPKTAPEIATGRAIVAHLGSGASLCAMKGGASTTRWDLQR